LISKLTSINKQTERIPCKHWETSFNCQIVSIPECWYFISWSITLFSEMYVLVD